MRLLLATEVQLGRNLQVEVVIDVACSDDMGVEVLLAARHNASVDVMPDLFTDSLQIVRCLTKVE